MNKKFRCKACGKEYCYQAHAMDHALGHYLVGRKNGIPYGRQRTVIFETFIQKLSPTKGTNH